MPGVTSARLFGTACAALLALALSAFPAGATSRIKDLANIEGVRQNQLIGYGLVVGLNGTGDTLNNIPFTKQSLQAMLERMGVNIRGATIRTGNVAAVMVTGDLPPFATQGTRMDVTVSALGDAKNLQGGTLLVTPLLGADGNVYAVAQGSLAISGFQAEGEAAKIVRGVPTVGRIANGAIIEREIEFALNRLPNVRLALRNADFTTAKRIAAAVNDFLGVKTAEPIDPSTVQLAIPAEFKGNVVAFLTEIEQLQVDPDLAAKIVIDERSGIIVMGRDVRVATVAVAQGNLTVTISESRQVSQPNPLSRGQTKVVPRTSIGVSEDGSKLAVVKDGVSLQQLVDGLNGLGISERETELVRAGKVAAAMSLEPNKTDLSRRYVSAVEHLKASQPFLSQTAPELLATLHRHHDVFRAMLQINLTVLATAHAVSESIVRGVNAEIQRRNIPNTYTAAGRRATPGPRHMTPLAVSRSL